MLNFRKVAFRSFVLGSLVLFGAALLRTPLTAPVQGHSGITANLASFADSAIARADSAVNSFAALIPFQLKPLPHQGSAFIQRNATTARLQFEGMKNSVSARLTVSGWFGKGAPNWIQNGAQTASQAGENKAHTLARKVPVVTASMDATRDRVNAVAQSVSNSSLGF